MGDCDIWRSALLWVVPASVAELEGRVRGEEITFRAGRREYQGRLVDGRLELR